MVFPCRRTEPHNGNRSRIPLSIRECPVGEPDGESAFSLRIEISNEDIESTRKEVSIGSREARDRDLEGRYRYEGEEVSSPGPKLSLRRHFEADPSANMRVLCSKSNTWSAWESAKGHQNVHTIPPFAKHGPSAHGFLLAAMVVASVQQARRATDEWRARVRVGDARDPPPVLTAARRSPKRLEATTVVQAEARKPEDRLTEEELQVLAAREAADLKRREEQYQRAVQEEQERIRAEQEREKKEREKADPIVQEELRKREEMEKKLREEAREKARIQALERAKQEELKKEELRNERERMRKKLIEDREAARKKAEAERRAQREQERKQRIQAEKNGELFYLDLQGDVEMKPQFGKSTLQISLKSVECPGATTGRASTEFVSSDEAKKQGRALVKTVVLDAVEAHATAVRTRDLMLEETVLQFIDDMEFDHWLLQARILVEIEASRAYENACMKIAASERGRTSITKFSIPFTLLYERKIQPEGSPQRLRSHLEDALACIREGTSSGMERGRQNVVRGIELEAQELDAIVAGSHLASTNLGNDATLRPFVWPVLTLAAFLDRVPDGEQSTYEKAKALVRSIIQDELSSNRWEVGRLQEEMRLAEDILGSQSHPCVVALGSILDELTDDSPERLLELAWPERQALRASVASARAEESPIPEQCWAMRNVAYTFARTNAEGQAKKLLQDAIELKKSWLGDPFHPGLLPEYQQLVEVLYMNQDWAKELEDACRKIVHIVGEEANRLESGGDSTRATILRRGCLQEYGMAMGKEDQDVNNMLELVMQAMRELDPDQRARVEEACQEPDVVKILGEEYAKDQEIASRKSKAKRSIQ